MKKYPIALFVGSFLLICFGMIILMSASSNFTMGHNAGRFSMVLSQFAKASLGLFAMLVFAAVPYTMYRKLSKVAMFVIVAILIATLFMPEKNHVRRWFTVGIISFQSVDFAKVILIVHLAVMIEQKGELIKDFKNGFLYMIIWIFTVCGLVILQPNVSNSIVIFLVAFFMLFIAGAELKHLAGSLVGAAIPAFTLMMIFPHSRARVFQFIDGLLKDGEINYQVSQAIIGLGSGGIYGLGFGHSNQRNLFLPEAYGDFIFAIVGEETGFIGAILLLSAYVTMAIIGFRIAKNAVDTLGQMLAAGISISFILHALIHISVSSGLTPTTGLPLPFISHGGTSLLTLCSGIGILINVGLTGINEQQPKPLQESVT